MSEGYMTVPIPYGHTKQMLCIPRARIRSLITPHPLQRQNKSEDEIVLDALEHPISGPRLRDLSKGRQKITLITSDHTRPMPSRVTLPLILSEIRSGNAGAEITILVATGLHRSPTQHELEARFGPEITQRERIIIHNADDRTQMEDLGVLPSGGPLLLNHLVTQADLVVAEGFIEPHFFAGFSGGRKSILPGVAARESIMYNHSAAFISSPRARQGSLEQNPIHEDMRYAAQKARLAFILNVILDEERKIAFAVAGDCEKAHARGCEICISRAGVRSAPADIVITGNGGYPLDQNLYQAVKCMSAAERCVRPGGAIIVCAALEDGHGGDAFYHWFSDRPGPEAVLDEILNTPADKTVPDQWQAQILARVMLRARVCIVTEACNKALVENMHMRFFPDVNSAYDTLSREIGNDPKVSIIPNGVEVIL